MRFRFALATAAVLLIILAAFGTFIYQGMSRRLVAAVDTSLELVSSQVASGLEWDGDRLIFPEPFHQEPENLELAQRGFTAWVFAPGGGLLGSFGRQQSSMLPMLDASSPPRVATVLDTGNPEGMRIRAQAAGPDANRPALIVVAMSLEEVGQTLTDLRTTLLIAVPGLVVMAGVLGYLLAARALAPVDRITRTAQRISAGNLSERIGLPSSDDEIGRLAETLDGMLARLEASFRRERQFSADAAHELRTPLAGLKVILDSMSEGRHTAEEYRQALADLALESDRLQRTTGGLLELARLEDEDHAPSESVDLSTLLNDLAESFEPKATSKGSMFRGRVANGLKVAGSSDELVRLFANLLDNAVKFTPSGAIDLSAWMTAAGEVIVEVRDTGNGIPELDLPHVFERFYRVDRSRAFPGAGLGLSISAAYARAHGARIEAESTFGKGSCFRVVFPTPSSIRR